MLQQSHIALQKIQPSGDVIILTCTTNYLDVIGRPAFSRAIVSGNTGGLTGACTSCLVITCSIYKYLICRQTYKNDSFYKNILAYNK